MRHTGGRGRRGVWLRLWALMGLLALCMFDRHDAQARLRPYHEVRSGASSQNVVRIVVIVDSSGSMAAASDGSGDCPFAECEDIDSPRQSKVAAARAAIRAVAATTEGSVEFGFLGFTRPDPPNGPNRVPAKCQNGNRFRWVTQARSLQGTNVNQPTNLGDGGVWELCGAQRPFPYLRHDELGAPNPGQHSVGALPPSPMNPNLANPANASRRVQWFPRYFGPRVHPNADLAERTFGDFTVNQVTGRDFYYWPYVDGFPGYTDHQGNAGGRLGVAAHHDDQLQLYGPLYVNVDPALLNPNYVGPASAEEARAELLDAVAPMMRGGIDVDGGAIGWDNVIGPLPNAPLSQNSIFSSTTIARYVQFLSLAVEAADEGCGRIAVILVTDGKDGTSSRANYRLAQIAKELRIGTYVIVVGDTVSPGINHLACAGTGACDGSLNSCHTPCNDHSSLNWSTCADPQNPTSACAWQATSAKQLGGMFAAIVSQVLEAKVQTGQGATVNDFSLTTGNLQAERLQTRFVAYTEVPAWRGHVERRYCEERDPDDPSELAAWCTPPNPEFGPDEVQPTFGPCPQSRAWDAGECLQQTPWNERRLFTHDENNHVVPIADADGKATSGFKSLLSSMGLLTSNDTQAEADAVAAFVLGRDAPKGWKLPGVANSSPVVVRRVPPYRAEQVPEVAIRDPHCGGRFYPAISQGDLPQSLEDFARGVWDTDDADAYLQFPAPHFAYQEAVLVGDDMGVLHAFALDSGNELWGFVPRFLLGSLKQQVEIGAETMGQPPEIANHIFGIAATLNHAWVHDKAADRWRHLGIFGFGAGGTQYVALELSHMSPYSTAGPFEILWTSEDPDLKAAYDAYNGETWARPAITYWVPDENLGAEPEARLVMGSGYKRGNGTAEGRTLVFADAVDGTVEEHAVLPAISHAVYESDFGAVVDPAVGSHCLSRFWAEAQETYIADPAGRLFRWDLGRTSAHEADSDGPWQNHAAKAVPVGSLDHFPACTGTGPTCTVAPNNKGDVFVFAPAVSANDRLDDASTVGNDPEGRDQFLVALVSGSPNEDTIDGFVAGLDFHSSLYLLVDDHRQDKAKGFEIPNGAPKSTTGTVGGGTALDEGESRYLRLALTDLQRTRHVVPYPGADPIVDTRNFSRQTRPVRSPRILVTGVVDPAGANGEPTVVEGIEVYFVEFTVYEPPGDVCDPGFYDPDTHTWHKDHGSTFVITLRLTADAASGFDFTSGTTNESVDFGPGFTRGLSLESVQQVGGDACPSGNCGAQPDSGGMKNTPCQRNDPGFGNRHAPFAVPVRSSQITAFTPID